MTAFIEKNQSLFNESQKEALEKVAMMKDADILLVQGPPGTGKTHTIHGIVSMICETGHKVLVCTPSNSAVDEIVLRLGAKENKFKTSGNLRDKIVRVGAFEQSLE
jgi:senataxin